MNVLPVLLKDGYKVGHVFQYPPDTTMVYSNLTARRSRTGFDGVIAFGFQYFVKEYLIRQFNQNFFQQPRQEVLDEYRRRIDNYLGGHISTDHIARLHDLGYLPLLIKAVPEGTLVPTRVPMLTIRNTKPEFYWLTNMLETLLSNIVWLPCTSATTAFQYRRTFERYARETSAPRDFVPWQGHDFSFRGLAGVEAAMLSGAAHLLSFAGTDTIPAIDFLEEYYGADVEKELIGGSVPATEHSVMCMGLQETELETFERLLMQVYPTGVVSVVSDTWDFWKVLTEYLPALKDVILKRDGKLVIRPDSGDPTYIICGNPDSYLPHEYNGAISVLWDIFGGTVNDGYKQLDPHIGLIYGEAITLERQEEILSGLKRKGFASSNVVFGIGSFTYQHVTRDTYGFAVKSTYGETAARGGVPIFKNPATDTGSMKRSALGLIRVTRADDGSLRADENVSWLQEEQGLLRPIFEDGMAQNVQTLTEIRMRVEAQL